MQIKLNEAVNDMVDALKEAAENNGVAESEIRKLLKEGKINQLDDLFGDSGETRTEQFTDLSIDYACQYGKIESDGFNTAHWKAVEQAMKKF